MRRWMGARCAEFLVRWKADDRACIGSAGLSRVRDHRYAQGDDWPIYAGVADPVGGSVRRGGLCLSRAARTVRFIMLLVVRFRAAGRGIILIVLVDLWPPLDHT